MRSEWDNAQVESWQMRICHAAAIHSADTGSVSEFQPICRPPKLSGDPEFESEIAQIAAAIHRQAFVPLYFAS